MICVEGQIFEYSILLIIIYNIINYKEFIEYINKIIPNNKITAVIKYNYIYAK